MTKQEKEIKAKTINWKLIKHAYLYYEKDKPEISDLEYDALYLELKELIDKGTSKPDYCMLDRVGSPSARAYMWSLHKLGEWG